MAERTTAKNSPGRSIVKQTEPTVMPVVPPGAHHAKLKLKLNDIALHDKLSQSYEVSLDVWDHTVLPATRHK